MNMLEREARILRPVPNQVRDNISRLSLNSAGFYVRAALANDESRDRGIGRLAILDGRRRLDPVF